MSAKTVEKRRKWSWPLYLMLRKDIYKAWIHSDKALFYLPFTTGETKIQHISCEKRRKDAALLEKASKPSSVMVVSEMMEGYRASNFKNAFLEDSGRLDSSRRRAARRTRKLI
ncbi:hypothetical protein TNCV_1876711 [Trichonephila clavipes]|nr:hypothetical protein TNCV_1876711 [Trichonephila clavipes]